MEIRATEKDFKRFKKYKTGATITLDRNLNESVIMVHIAGKPLGNGEHEATLQEWTRGRANIESFLERGYVRIKKNCPYRLGKCICEQCSLYVIKNSTGDCAHIWNALNI